MSQQIVRGSLVLMCGADIVPSTAIPTALTTNSYLSLPLVMVFHHLASSSVETLVSTCNCLGTVANTLPTSMSAACCHQQQYQLPSLQTAIYPYHWFWFFII